MISLDQYFESCSKAIKSIALFCLCFPWGDSFAFGGTLPDGLFIVTAFEKSGTARKITEDDTIQCLHVNGMFSLEGQSLQWAFGNYVHGDLYEKRISWIDITSRSGTDHDSAYLGICRISPSPLGETISICFSPEGSPRPESFISNATNGCTLLRFRRRRNPQIKKIVQQPEIAVMGGVTRFLIDIEDLEHAPCYWKYRVVGEDDWVEGKTEYGRPLILPSASSALQIPVANNQNRPLDYSLEFAFIDHSERNEKLTEITPEISKATESPVKASSRYRYFTNAVSMQFVRVPSGSIIMHRHYRPQGERSFQPAHVAKIPEFWLMQNEVRIGDFNAIMEKKIKGPSSYAWTGATPILVNRFISRLNALPQEKRQGRTYRLPTEEEWEYAARAGTVTPWWTGDSLVDGKENVRSDSIHVRRYGKNPFGLYDMLGNVSELCFARDGWSNSSESVPGDREIYAARGGNHLAGADGSRADQSRWLTPAEELTYSGGVRLVCERE